MSPADLRAHAYLARLLDRVVDSDVHVRKCGSNHANDGLDASRARALTWRQRNVVPFRGEYGIDEIRVLFAESAIQRLYGNQFGT